MHHRRPLYCLLHSHLRLHAVSFGRRPGLPLMLFLHGFPECWYSWGQQLAAFAGKYEVVALDMRGYNTSSKPKVCACVGWVGWAG